MVKIIILAVEHQWIRKFFKFQITRMPITYGKEKLSFCIDCEPDFCLAKVWVHLSIKKLRYLIQEVKYRTGGNHNASKKVCLIKS